MSDALKAALELMADFDIFDWSEFVTKFDINMTIPDLAKLMKGEEPEVKYIKKLDVAYRLLVKRVPAPNHHIIQAIKLVREITNWGLKEAKDFIYTTNYDTPSEIMQGSLTQMQTAFSLIDAKPPIGFIFSYEEVTND